MLDDGKVEELDVGPRPRRRHPGRRRRDHRASPTPPTCPRPACVAAAEAAAAAARGGGGGTRIVDLTRQDRSAAQRRSRSCPDDVAKATKVELLTRADEVARGQGAAITPGDRPATATAAAASSSPTPTASSPTTTRSAPCSRSSCVATGDTGMQTGRETHRPHRRLRAVRPLRRRGAGPPGRRAGPHQARRPPGAQRRSCRSSSARAAAACCSTRRAATASRPTSSPRAPRSSPAGSGEQVASPLVTLVDDGTMAGEWGCFAIDDEGRPAQRNVLIEDGVLTDYMWDHLRARKEGRPALGQRPAPELPAPADGAHDQHRTCSTAPTTPTTSSPAPSTASTSPSSAAARSTPPPATSCSA